MTPPPAEKVQSAGNSWTPPKGPFTREGSKLFRGDGQPLATAMAANEADFICARLNAAAPAPSGAQSERESVATAMIECGLVTGHGDTLGDLLGEMKAQVTEIKADLHAASEAANSMLRDRAEARASAGSATVDARAAAEEIEAGRWTFGEGEICPICDGDSDECPHSRQEIFAFVIASKATGDSVMTEAQIKHMANRFLGWKLPTTFNPDNGISVREGGWSLGFEPSGTNLFDATQAEAMVRYMIDGIATHSASAGSAVYDGKWQCDNCYAVWQHKGCSPDGRCPECGVTDWRYCPATQPPSAAHTHSAPPALTITQTECDDIIDARNILDEFAHNREIVGKLDALLAHITS